MTRRSYHMTRRGGSAEATRRRIVEATFALHAEQGIAATSMKQIAARAGVSIGAVYHHFPTLDDAIGGCAAHVRASFPFPDGKPIEAQTTLAGRVAAFLDICISFAARFPPAEQVRLEAHVSRHVASFVEDEARHRLNLARLALAPVDAPAEAVQTLAAMGDVAVLNALVRAGLSPARASQQLKAVALAWLTTLPASHPLKEPERANQDR